MQGEADAQSESAARAYEVNLRRVIGRLRHEMGDPALPLVIGKITDSGMDEDGLVMDHIALVQAAQARMVESDSCAAYVTETDAYEHGDDRWHYRSEGFLKMGKAFARAMSDRTVECLTQGNSPE